MKGIQIVCAPQPIGRKGISPEGDQGYVVGKVLGKGNRGFWLLKRLADFGQLEWTKIHIIRLKI